MMNFLGVGDNVCDVYLHEKTMYPGGQALNLSVYMRRLGARSAYFGLFGNDELAAHVCAALDAEGVDRSRCRTVQAPNGYAMVDLVDGDRHFVGSNKSGPARTQRIVRAEDMPLLAGFDLIHTSNNSHLDDCLSLLRESGARLSYDFSLSWKDEKRFGAVCPQVDFAFFSCGDMPDEEAWALAERAQALGCKTAVATLGSRGALCLRNGMRMRHALEPVQAVDTMGAGDSFAAAFLYSIVGAEKRGEEGEAALRAAMEHGARFAATTCLVRGAFGYGAPVSDEQITRMMQGIIR